VNPRKLEIQIKNVNVIANKINKLVNYYARIKYSKQWVYSTTYDLLCSDDMIITIKLYQIDYERNFCHNGFDYIYNNSPFCKSPNFSKKQVTMKNIIDSFVKIYNPEYLEIEKFINKMLYSYPQPLKEEDFIKLNQLYNKMKTEGIDNSKNMEQHFK